jgi:hypothetical protein
VSICALFRRKKKIMAKRTCKHGIKKGGCRKRPRGGVKRGKKCKYGKVKGTKRCRKGPKRRKR